MTIPAGVFPSGTPNLSSFGTLASANDSVTINTDTLGAVGVSISGTNAGATVVIEGTISGTSWDTIKAYPLIVGAAGVTSIGAAGDFEFNCGAFKQVRARLSVAGSGSFSATLNGTFAAKHIGVKNGNPADLNATVVQSGSTGTDYSANKPTIPNVGAAFGASGPYANYVLVATVPASPTRNNIDIENISGAQIAVVRDDGTAANGAAPANASVFTLAGGASAGAQGGAWSSQTFKGRLQIYAPSAAAIVSVMVD
ncbi:hypothetical protein [Burkholderia vietnamiensis]|uniref:Uncharacterized protein n=1 Tax=Burkholderia vietnamiensis TaxID=60552 RepID=A0AAW7T2L9_BURVI|nr:hypothetical protein [Burkholderia vietnamiensis]MDN7795819.1 hypothetical protein [Burkholderia vietnamiensis]HDR9029961.1 hypothetical protein [Burkholderia vietnamiensis]